MIGGGFGWPVRRWLSLDLVNMDFGFGNTAQSQTLLLENGSAASTKNYQMLFGTGPRLNVPIHKGFTLGLEGGFAAAVQNEYVPDQSTTVGGVTTIVTVDCTSCTHNNFQGSYAGLRIFGRSNKYNGLGIDAKYYMLKDSNGSLDIYSNIPPQNWLTVGLVFSFGI
jgi:hypothetical protein